MAASLGKVVLLGAGGMLGRAFAQRLQAAGSAVDVPKLDLSRQEAVAALPVADGATVINCAAWTDVDGAEAAEAEATVVNGHAVGWLAERCHDAGATLVHFSTDYVFDGNADAPYPIDHPRSPVNAYGRSKAEGEVRVLGAGAEVLLVRTSWLYAPWGKNFVKTMAALGQSRDHLRVVDDQRGRPTSAEGLVDTTLALLEVGYRGIAHATDGGECTWYELAKAVIERVSPSCRVVPCTSEEFVRPAPRPAYSVLDLSETERAIGHELRPWPEAVDDVVTRL